LIFAWLPLCCDEKLDVQTIGVNRRDAIKIVLALNTYINAKWGPPPVTSSVPLLHVLVVKY
jgi:hypothetical protein